MIGLVFLLPFLYFLIRGRVGRALWPKLALIFVLGALQGVLGWYMVESGLEHRIEVSQYRLAAHLFAAIVIYGAILWVAFDLLWTGGSRRHVRAERPGGRSAGVAPIKGEGWGIVSPSKRFCSSSR